MKKKEGLKVLLLQIRRDQQVRREEHESFCDYSGLAKPQVDIHNVFDKPHFEPNIVDGYAAGFRILLRISAGGHCPRWHDYP